MIHAFVFFTALLSAHAKSEAKADEGRQIASEEFCQRLKRVGFVAFVGTFPKRAPLDYEHISGQGRVEAVFRNIEYNSCPSLSLRIRGKTLEIEKTHDEVFDLAISPENAAIFALRTGDSIDVYKEGDTLRISDHKD